MQPQKSVSEITQWLPVNSTFCELLMTVNIQAKSEAPVTYHLFSKMAGAHFVHNGTIETATFQRQTGKPRIKLQAPSPTTVCHSLI